MVDLTNDTPEDAHAVWDKALRYHQRCIDERHAPASSMSVTFALVGAGVCGFLWYGLSDPVLGVCTTIFSMFAMLFVAVRWQLGRLSKAIQQNGDSSLVWRVFSKSLHKGLSIASTAA